MGTVDDYLAQLDPSVRPVLSHLYDLARELVPDAGQGVSYGMPALTYRGRPLLAVMQTKRHIGVYPFSPAAIDEVRDLLEGADTSKGSISFTPERRLPDEAVRALVAARKRQIDG